MMLHIKKNKAPNSLVTYKQQPNAYYDGPKFTEIKNEIKDILLAEQGFLCAYCMSRISKDKMKVEHWACQSLHPQRQLDYSNLLGCCMGHEGQPPNKQTCDTSKCNYNIKYSPSDKLHNIDSIITYTADGIIHSTDLEFDRQINEILNLNESRLVLNRKIAYEKIRKVLNNHAGTRTNKEIDNLFQKYSQRNTENMSFIYVGVILFYLKKRMKR